MILPGSSPRMARYSRICLMLLCISRPALAADDRTSPAPEDLRLWKAAVTGKFYHNHIVMLPESWSDHAELVTRTAESNLLPRRKFMASAITARDYFMERYLALLAKDRTLKSDLPSALGRSSAYNVLKTLLKREPSPQEMMDDDAPGGFVSKIDKLRETKMEESAFKLYITLFHNVMADEIETEYRRILQGARCPRHTASFLTRQATRSVFPRRTPATCSIAWALRWFGSVMQAKARSRMLSSSPARP